MFSGGCLCGAVQYEISGNLGPYASICHCTQCRKQTGHAFAAAEVADSDLKITKDEGFVWYRASDVARRGFCKNCASFLFWKEDKADKTFVGIGSVVPPTGIKNPVYIFTEDAGDYYSTSGPPPDNANIEVSTIKGSCLCGACSFTLPHPAGDIHGCHCSQCRRRSAYFTATFDAKESDVVWTTANPPISEYTTPGGAKHGFCSNCFAKLYYNLPGVYYGMPAGILDGPTGGTLSSHIFFADRGDFYKIDDGMPTFDGLPDFGGSE